MNIENENEFSNEKSSSYGDNMDSLNSIKSWSVASIIGWFLILIPGMICSIVLIIKLFTYKYRENSKNDDLRIIAAILSIFTTIVGPIIALIFAKREIENLEKNK